MTREYDKMRDNNVNDNGGVSTNSASATIAMATATATGRTRKNGVRLLRGGRRHNDKQRGGRELLVIPVPMVENVMTKEFMTIVDVECSNETTTSLQDTDHCIQVTTNLTISFTNEPLGSEQEALAFFENEFAEDCKDETFHNMIQPDETRDMIRAISLPTPPPPTNVANDIPTPKPSPGISDAVQPDDEEGGSNVAGIVSGVIFGFVFVGLFGFFVYRRGGFSDTKSKDSGSDFSYKKNREFDPSADLEGGNIDVNKQGSKYSSSGSSGSSRDEFSSGDSQSSGSMQSFSGSDSSRSSNDSRSSYTSRSSRTSRSSATSRSSRYSTSPSSTSKTPPDTGPESVSASETDSFSSASASADANSPYEGGGVAVTRAAALGRARSHGSSEEDDGSARRGSLHSKSDSHGSSSVGDASDPRNVMDEGSSMGSRSSPRSRGSKSSATSSHHTGDSSEPYKTNVDLMDVEPLSKSTTTGEDSSAGSSGWDSSDGDSSVDTGSVDSYDPNDLGSSAGGSTYPSASSSSGDASTSMLTEEQGLPAMMNPAVNPVVQRGVTMLPIEEEPKEDETLFSDDSEGSGIGRRRDHPPLGGDIQDAIEKGDWEAVGATAAILADSDSSHAEDNATRDSNSTRQSGGSIMSDILSTGGSGDEDEDDVRAAEIDQLVENGNWDGVVAVAARYADEADEADSQLGSPISDKLESSPSTKINNSMTSRSDSTQTGTRSDSVGSVSVETADASSVNSNTTRDDSNSHTTYSGDSYLDEMGGDGASTVSGSNSRTPPRDSSTPPDSNTQSSSITSSYVSAGGITSSMISAVSSVDQQEKRQMNAYKAEVEALVRRVVPDEMDNVDDIMVQFSGREEELIETLRSMQEKSIAQRARAAVQKSAKMEAGKTGRQHDESSEDLGGQSVTTDGDGQSMTTDGQYTNNTRSENDSGGSYSTSSSESRSRRTGSITEQYTGVEDDYSSSSGSSGSASGSVSSYSSGVSGMSNSTHQSILSQLGGSLGIISVGKTQGGDDIVKTSPGLGEAIEASDWRAVGEAAAHLERGDGSTQPNSLRSVMTGMSTDTHDELDNMIDKGNWSGIIDAASNMTGGVMNSDGSGSEVGLNSLD